MPKGQFTRGTKNAKCSTTTIWLCTKNTRSVYMQCLIMHAFQYPSYRKKRNNVTSSLRNRWRPPDY